MSELTRTDITAVKLSEHYIIASTGSSLELYKRESGKFIQKITALRGQKIYGIVPTRCQSKLLVFGGKQFTIMLTQNLAVNTDDVEIVTHHTDPIICDDWLHSGIWFTESKIAFLTAHNVVEIWNTETQTLQKQYVSPNNSILYSGLLLPLQDDILIFSGTVFSEVILQWCGDDKPLNYLRGHKGVIFSINCDPLKGIIVTTSDDRSVRIWSIKTLPNLEYNSKNYWQSANIVCTYELYGHSSRVMRNSITNDYIISIGEDSGICFWSHEGKLIRKILSHQNACIWSLDADNKHLVTGGGDSSVILHPLSLLTEYGVNEIADIAIGSSKKVQFTARGNIVIINDSNDLIYHDLKSKRNEVHKLNLKSTYTLLSLSYCRQIIAVVDRTGNLMIFIENCKGDPEIKKIINTQLDLGNILFMHWASNRHLVICSDNGIITVLASKDDDTEILASLCLPACKERWLTSCTLSSDSKILVAADRCGHIHVYLLGNRSPVKTFYKVHGRYGATNIIMRNNQIITTGRDGTIKYFSINRDNMTDIKYMSCRELEFQWVEKFLDKNENYICGFQERVFIVYDLKYNMKMLEVNCGGGHRSWDAVRYFDKVDNNIEEFIRLMYLKNSSVHIGTFQLSKIVSNNIIHGTHSKEINCLKTYTCNNVKDTIFYISGGEDTTLRISSSCLDIVFHDEVIFKQLSSIRSLKLLPLKENSILLVSAGGRAQICVKIINFRNDETFKIYAEELVDYLIKGTDKERKGNRTWKDSSLDIDPEIRIMDLDMATINDHNFNIFAGCSDGVLRVFSLKNIDKVEFKPVTDIKYHQTCILKTHIFNVFNKDIVVTCSTRGEIAFWDIKKACTESVKEPIYVIQTNKSGINSIDVKFINNAQFLLGTGGDDNAIHLNIIEIENNDLKSMKTVHTWMNDKTHCSQITGLKFIEDVMVTTGIDQRITIFKLSFTNVIDCALLSQYYSDIADIQGMDVLNFSEDFIDICVFGKGVQVIKIPRNGII